MFIPDKNGGEVELLRVEILDLVAEEQKAHIRHVESENQV
jgi:hypothetical protein